MARDYNQEFPQSERPYFHDFDGILRHYMIKTFVPWALPGPSLEMGCYEGYFTELILNDLKLSDLDVIEAASDLVEKVKKRTDGKAQIFCSRFEDFTATRTYQNIFLIHTLEHLDEPIEILKKVKTWLSPKGRLFLCCPNANAISRQLAVKMGMITHNQEVTKAERDHGHRATYSLDVLESQATRAGLKIECRGGVVLKPLANFQFDLALKAKVIDEKYIEACYKLGQVYPDLSASIYLICNRGDS